MALSADKAYKVIHAGVTIHYGVAASTLIYQGSAVGDNGSGFARKLVAADPFLGFAIVNRSDNSSGAAGATQVEVLTSGVIEVAAITGSTGVGDIGDSVYMSDDGTFTETSTSNSLIGKIAGVTNRGTYLVSFQGGQIA